MKRLENTYAPTLMLSTLKGYKYVQELRSHPGIPIEITRLYCLDQVSVQKNIGDESDLMFIPFYDVYIGNPAELPIPMLDSQALNDMKRRRKQLQHYLDIARGNNDYGAIDDCMDEIESIENYLRECLDSKGRIRNFSTVARKNASSVLRAVQYYIRKLNELDPNEAVYIAKHVVIGQVCYWSIDPVNTSLIPTA